MPILSILDKCRVLFKKPSIWVMQSQFLTTNCMLFKLFFTTGPSHLASCVRTCCQRFKNFKGFELLQDEEAQNTYEISGLTHMDFSAPPLDNSAYS